MAKLKLGSLAALLIGPVLLFTNYKETTEKKQIMQEGISTIAVPTAKISRRGRRGGRSYKLEIEYAVQGGTRRTERVSVSKDLYDKAESQPIINIKYLAKDPSKLIIVGEPMEQPEMYVIGGIIFALGAAGTWWYFLRKSPQQVAPPVMPANA
jgi:hypothetical protein